MKQIFKKASGSPTATDKVGEYNFKEHYPDVNRNMGWSEITPYIRQATRRFILPYLGQELYDDIANKVENNIALNDTQTEFLERLRDAVAYCAVMVMLPKKKTVVASMGAVENVATEGTTGTSLWGFKTTLWSVAQDADRNTDELMAYLEEQVQAGNAYFDLWKNSTVFEKGRSPLFRTTEEFQRYQNINSSRRTFVAMLPIIQMSAKVHLLPVVGTDMYNELVDQVAEGSTLTDENTTLLDYVRTALAAWSVHYAADKLPILPDQDGFRLISNAEAVDQRQYSTEIMQGAIERIKYSAENEARRATADLVAFLHDNKDDYPLWKDSSANPENDTDGPYGPYACEHGAIML